MAAQTLFEIQFYQWMNKSHAKLESQLQTLFNEFRSIRTSLEPHQTQNSSPPSTSVTVSSLPPSAANAPPNTTTTPPISSPVSALKSPPQQAPISSVQFFDASVQSDIKLNSFKAISEFEEKFGVNHKRTREWRIPWRLMKTSPNATVQVEWRPPWCIQEIGPDFILEDKDILSRNSFFKT
ncbi:hypothetical protein Hanom_Chr09g00768081 [Helianthus anomalus]